MQTNMVMASIGCMLAFLFVSGCNVYDVSELKYDPELKQVCLVDNSNVIVDEFVTNLEDEFNDRRIKVKHVDKFYEPAQGEYLVKYTARQSWDFSTYLSYAQIRIYKDNAPVAQGTYRHRGGSFSLALNKWNCVSGKMAPLYSELFKEYNK